MTVKRSRLAGLLAAALAAATGLVGLSPSSASAALCSGKGVNVVVDFNELGGGVPKGCDPGGGGKPASDVFPAAGFRLDYVTNSAFVCKVKSLPSGNACAHTPPADAYWALFWSDGKSGKWNYASSGVNGLSVPNGGFLAFSWQNTDKQDPPSASPVNQPTATTAPTKTATPKPTRTPKPTKAPKTPKPTKTASAAASAATTGSAASTSASPSARASVSASASASASTSPSASESAVPSETLEPTPDVTGTQKVDSAFTPEEEPSGLPAWVPITVIVALAGAAGGAVWWRRRTGAP